MWHQYDVQNQSAILQPKKPVIYYKFGVNKNKNENENKNEIFGNFYLANDTRYSVSDPILASSFNGLVNNENILNKLEHENEKSNYKLSLENSNYLDIYYYPVQPNIEKPGGPNLHINKIIVLDNSEYNLRSKHVEYFEQQMGARHPMWCNKDVK